MAETNIYNLINYLKNTLKDKEDNDALLKIIKEILSETFNSQKEFKDFDNFLKSKSEKLEAKEEKNLLNFIEELGFSIDDNENQEIHYFKSLCTCLDEKVINIHMSEGKEEIINYFSKTENDKSKNLNNNNEEIYKEDKILFEKINLMYKMVKFFNVQLKELFPNNLEMNEFSDKACKLIKSFFLEEKLRIPVIGCYNAGKTSIINSFIGDDLLPVETTENTKEIIFIRYHNFPFPTLLKSNIKKENFGNNRY